MVTHLRIHRANDLTWCQRRISTNPNLRVVTVTERHHFLTSVHFNSDGTIDYTPMTREEKAELRTLRNFTYSQVTCRKCTDNGRRFQVED